SNVPAPGNMAITPKRKPVSMLLMNGTADPFVPWNGGDVVLHGVWGNRGAVLSTQASIDYFLALDGLVGPPATTQFPDIDPDAGVVWSGPNGLSAAIELARAGLRVHVHEAEPTIGGGTRSAELTLPGFLHDVCSAIHPMAAASPFFSQLRLAEHGLEWVHPEIELAHPLPDGTAVAVVRSVEETANGLG